jgi:hypothetical protein
MRGMSEGVDREHLVDALDEQRAEERLARDEYVRRELEQVDNIASTVAKPSPGE